MKIEKKETVYFINMWALTLWSTSVAVAVVAGINTKLLRVGTTWFCFALAGMPDGGMVCGFRTVTLVFMPDFGKGDRKEEKKEE